MSTTTTIHPESQPTSPFVHISSSCPQCGAHISASLPPHALHSEDADPRIRDLEAQVKLLNSKAAAAVDKLADYEDEVRHLRAARSRSQPQSTGLTSTPPENHPPPERPTTAQSRLSSFSAFLPGRRTAPPPLPPTPNSASLPPPPSPLLHPSPTNAQFTNSTPNLPSHTSDLSSALEAERRARLTAETTLSQTQSEIEDLTAKLFGEANEMVAAERRARAKLEERVAVLEKRDGDKRRRLDRLEKALERIERVRGMVGGVQ